MTEQRVLLDSTGSILLTPRIRRFDGRIEVASITGTPYVRTGTPASAMPTTWTQTGVTALAALSASTLSSAASEGATSLAVASMSTIARGMEYVIVDATTGARIMVTAKVTANSATTFYLEEPLPVDVATGSTITCIPFSLTLSAAQTAQVGRGLVLCKATIYGTEYQWREPFRIVRQFLNFTLTPTRLTQLQPELKTLRDRADDSFEELMTTAWDNRILRFLAVNDIDEDDVVNAHALETAHAFACLMERRMFHPSTTPEVRAAIEKEWAIIQGETLRARNDWWTAPQTETPALQEPTERAAHGIRLTR